MPTATGTGNEHVSLGYPKLRLWDLNETSSHHDHLIAAPSDEQLVSMWLGNGVVFSIFLVFNLLVFLAILLTKETRTNGFNQYLLAIMLPDIICNGYCALQSNILAATGSYYGHWCKTQLFVVVFFAISNFYLNAVVAQELKILLQASMRRQRYFPPSQKRICLLVTASYLWACLVATISLFIVQTDALQGVVCVPMVGEDTHSKLAYFLFLVPLLFIPILHVCYVALHIARGGLLPDNGRTREIAIFFARIFLVMELMWAPTIICFMVGAKNIWVYYFTVIWSHATGLVTSIFSLLKSDIRHATLDFICCQTKQANEEFDSSMNGTTRSRSSLDKFRNDRRRSSLFWRALSIFGSSQRPSSDDLVVAVQDPNEFQSGAFSGIQNFPEDPTVEDGAVLHADKDDSEVAKQVNYEETGSGECKPTF
ncbi:expressed unknown protein [Seminavis robusta]|uniref:G-protein coupled receptors family 1 profile domain-containing protein n=1 Tax=Seminavis robusta TaxID=568900 RepID=A0A9N8DGL5_9STRA|nr:expressed unknown protein [Seminavis robusta]|eukprot:Sro77_g042160.1 n/a (425) ;mRNA; f:82765-84039